MYTKPIRKKGARESIFWWKLKNTWCKFKYKEHWGKISKAEFFRNFKKYNEEYDLGWDYEEEGSIRWPTEEDYVNADKHGYFLENKYAWDLCYEDYKEDQLSEIQVLCREFKQKHSPKRIADNEKLRKKIRQDTWRLSENPEGKNQYRINKNLESEKLLDEQDALIIGGDDESIDVNVQGDFSAVVNRDLSSNEIMQFELEYAEKLIERAKK